MIERVLLPSRIRRGRMSTTPVWYATHNGRRMQFGRKKDALKYESVGCSDHKRYFCECRGFELEEAKKIAGVEAPVQEDVQ